ncbi:hypothetical protein QAD02_016198 [Eretmocerus hayati]|uniref:Uncharacterized protein n=1 Tax=Eretmocerus hayati TaxID=131215 RepID=A0ACC2PC80_9HYME|nr:hypothetical protein QAD02_016198 [Eretmocerus hayati]
MQYTGRVLIGFWFDKLQIESEKLEAWRREWAAGNLPLQRRRRLAHDFKRDIAVKNPPSTTDFSVIRYGQPLQLQCPEIPDESKRYELYRGCPWDELPEVPRQLGLLLSATCSRADYLLGVERMEDGCPVGCSPIRKHLARNIFAFERADEGSHRRGGGKVGRSCFTKVPEEDPGVLRYGQPFYIGLIGAKDRLYLRSEPPLVDGQFAPNYHNPVRLNLSRDGYALWRALHWDQHQRFETEGDPIVPCARIIIQHVMTGKNLAVENLNWHHSLFGFECGVSVHTYNDAAHRETSECIWNILAKVNDEDNKNKKIDLKKCGE